MSKVPELFDDPNDPKKYKRNLLKVEVYYDEFEYETIRDLLKREQILLVSTLREILRKTLRQSHILALGKMIH